MPDLIIIAGCNGAGKSTFASSFLPEGLTSFDYDRVFRIQVRTEFKGHFVDNKTIELKWKAGYKSLFHYYRRLSKQKIRRNEYFHS
ncbi:MAG: hypothetical protein LC658_00580 [Bacteroidales bacterium]|nr:hypothetical protein [Bacteroidales bacterium]